MESGFYIYDAKSVSWYGGDGHWYFDIHLAYRFGSAEDGITSLRQLKRRFARVVQVNVVYEEPTNPCT